MGITIVVIKVIIPDNWTDQYRKGYKLRYKQGQIDYYNNKIKYKLEKTKNSEIKWVKINKRNINMNIIRTFEDPQISNNDIIEDLGNINFKMKEIKFQKDLNYLVKNYNYCYSKIAGTENIAIPVFEKISENDSDSSIFKMIER